MAAAAPGWYGDPTGRFEWRYWTGATWSEWVASAGNVYRAPISVTATKDDLAHIPFTVAFLEDLRERGVIDHDTLAVALGELARREDVARSAGLTATVAGAMRPPLPGTAGRGAPAGPARPALYRLPLREATSAAPIKASRPQTVPRPASVRPAVRRGWVRLWSAVASDLGVYGLAYLGVLLLFAGVFGLVVFSFSGLNRELRPVAEVAIPTAAFGSAWLLNRRGPRVVSRMLVLAGGLLWPVVAIASFVDGAAVPPDLTGVPLVVVLTLVCLALAAIYAWVAGRWEGSSLRFLVGPGLWLAVAMAGLIVRHPIPRGRAVASPAPWQLAVVAVAVAATVAVARRGTAPLHTATEWAAVAAVPLVLLLAGLTASANGWPSAPIAVAAVASLATVEMLSGLVDARVVACVQTVIAAAALGACAPDWGLSWTGAVAVVVFLLLAEWEGRRRPSVVGTVTTLGAACAGLAVASTAPWPAVAAYGAATLWVHARRLRPARWLSPSGWLTVTAGVLPAGIAFGLAAALPAGPAAVAIAAGVAGVAVSVRLRHRTDDPLWWWWVPAAATVVVTGATQPQVPAVDVAIATALSAVAFGAAPRWPVLRAWTATVSALVSLGYVLKAADVAPATGAAVFAAVGLGLVALGTTRWLQVGGHIGFLGLAVLTAALVMAGEDAAGLGVLAAFTAGWIITVAADETVSSPITEFVVRALTRVHGSERVLRVARAVPGLMAVLSLGVLVLTAADTWGIVAADSPWSAVLLSGVALAYVVLGRWVLPGRRIGWLLTASGFWLTLVAVIASETEQVTTVAVGSAIVTIAVMDPSRRRIGFVWSGWALSAALCVLTARQAGIAGSVWYPVLLIWGATVTMGVLAWDDLRNGRRARGQWVRARWMWAPLVLGGVGIAVALAALFGQLPATYGWWSIVVAAVTAVIAWQLHLGALTTVSWSLGVVGWAALTPGQPVRHPWSLVPVAAALVVVSMVVGHRQQKRLAWWERWDMPPFVVANGVAIAALSATSRAGSVAVTYAATGGLAVAVAAWRRHPAWLIAGDLLLLSAGNAAGAGAAALVLVALAVQMWLAASRTHGGMRAGLQTGGVAALSAAAAELGAWAGLSADQAVVLAATGGGVTLVAVAAASRGAGLHRDWAATWSAPGVLALTIATGALFAGLCGRAGPGAATTVGWVLAAAAAAAAAAPLRQSWLREIAALSIAVAAATAAYAWQPRAAPMVAALTAAGLAATALTAALHTLRPSSRWARPCVIVATTANIAAAIVAAAEWPDKELLAAALAAAGAEAAVAGYVFRRVELLIAAPVLLCASWVTFAAEALGGNPEWYTIPIGLTLIAIDIVERAHERMIGHSPAVPPVVALEYVAMTFVVGSALMQEIVASLGYGLLALTLGAGLAAWGVATHVRRRLYFGTGVIVGAVILLIAVPVARAAPTWHGPALWIAVAVGGMVAMAAAAVLEQGHSRLHHTFAHLNQLTRGWE